MKHYVYADNAATTEIDIGAFDIMKSFLLNNYGNPSQPYSLSRTPKKAVKEARQCIAECIGANSDEIFFTSGGTESDNWAIKGTAFFMDKNKNIITSEIEHHAILNSCLSLEKMGYSVLYLQPDKNGVITPKELESKITNQTKFVSVMLANNEIGTIQPIKELCEIAHKHNALFHTDAVQAVGHINIDVKDLGIDLLSSSAHKFNGAKGTGFLYIKNGIEMHSFIDGGLQESNLRAGTENVAGIVCMATALKNNILQLDKNQKYVKKLETKLLSLLEKDGLNYIRNGGENTLPGLISLSFPGFDGEAILHCMDLMGIAISTGSACDSKRKKVSHVLKAISLDEKVAKGTIRISLGKNNTEEHIERIANSLAKILIKQ